MIGKSQKYIVITRPEKENNELSKELVKLGLSVLSYPTIKITKGEVHENFMSDLEQCDWVVFTSKNGVHFFIEKLIELGGEITILKNKKIGVVGPKTKEEAEKNGLSVDFIPSRFTTKDLGREIPVTLGQRVFLPRASIATPILTRQLIKKGGIVFNIPIYKTEYISKEEKRFKDLLFKEEISLITFTSPSTIRGFFYGLKNKTDKQKALSLPVLAIGPVTAKEAHESGFLLVYTANTFTTLGMIKKLKEIL